MTPSRIACAGLLPDGVFDDGQTSIVYFRDTGELAIDAPIDDSLTSLLVSSAGKLFNPTRVENLDGPLDKVRDSQLFKATLGGESFGSMSLGLVLPMGLMEESVLVDLTVAGTMRSSTLTNPVSIGMVDLIYNPVNDTVSKLLPGDADQDLDFDQIDIVRVLSASKYLTGDPATWGEGDWDGAPGGLPGEPPNGNGLFDQADILAALQSGAYLTGPYAASQRESQRVNLSSLGNAPRAGGQTDDISHAMPVLTRPVSQDAFGTSTFGPSNLEAHFVIDGLTDALGEPHDDDLDPLIMAMDWLDRGDGPSMSHLINVPEPSSVFLLVFGMAHILWSRALLPSQSAMFFRRLA
jgi:hypothetical protein